MNDKLDEKEQKEKKDPKTLKLELVPEIKHANHTIVSNVPQGYLLDFIYINPDDLKKETPEGKMLRVPIIARIHLSPQGAAALLENLNKTITLTPPDEKKKVGEKDSIPEESLSEEKIEPESAKIITGNDEEVYCQKGHQSSLMVKKEEYKKEGIERIQIKFRKYPSEIYVTEYQCPLCQKKASYYRAIPVGRPNWAKTWLERD